MDEDRPLKKRGNRTELMLLVLVFVVPILGAWLVYNFTDIGRNGGMVNHGTLIEPPAVIPDMTLEGGSPGSSQPLHGRWSLVYIVTGQCDRDCRDSLDMLTNLRLAMASKAERVQIVLVEAGVDLPEKMPAGVEWDKIHRVSGKDAEIIRVQAMDSMPGGSLTGREIFLIDPIGNLMMRYADSSQGSGLLEDLKRLLRYSRIG